jgi:hypothetical protein
MTLFYQRFSILFLAMLFNTILVAQTDEVFSRKNYTPTAAEIVAFYQKEALKNDAILLKMGVSNGNVSIYLFLKNVPKDSAKALEFARKNTVMLINNGIHAGEPDGINASMHLVREFDKMKLNKTSVLAIIPTYNVDGMLERSAFSRANQNGPDEYGFRATTQHFDLNRDFIKSDSKNAFAFAKIYQSIDPDVFVDTHVSNGADYQYTLTYIAGMKERMPASLCSLLYEKCLPTIAKNLTKKKIALFPYVSMIDDTLEHGITQFNDHPRYAFGYARLFHSLSFTTETHMLKPFDERVEVTYQFLLNLMQFTNNEAREIEAVRLTCKTDRETVKFYNYKANKLPEMICFRGFESGYKKSEITGSPRLYYDQQQPFEREIPFYKRFSSTDKYKVPRFLIVAGHEEKVIERLSANGVIFRTFSKDTTILVNEQRIATFESYSKPYEGHFYHRSVTVNRTAESLTFKKGDLLISTDQDRQNFLLNVLIPEMEDSYFRWNMFDSYLQQKEGFSDYVFEDLAVKLLAENADLNALFLKKKETDAKFASNPEAQLDFIYKNSSYYEPDAYRLPIFEIE